ncbi:MAG: hypothetical protein LBE85_11635, partial [Candidatus Accumulibacter sp.]|nr:hypothetical protein [Accumulibacter sp.]
MSIAIVSALPKSAPSPSADSANVAENAGAEFASILDLASLLFDQLTSGQGAGLLQGAAADGSGKTATDNEADPGDALDLLAALTQAPLERRDPL